MMPGETSDEHALRCVAWARDSLEAARRERASRLSPAPRWTDIEPEIVRPTPERAQHDPVEDTPEAIPDSKGGIGRPAQVVDLLTRWYRSGEISKDAYLAGTEYRVLATGAQLPGLRAADVGRVGGGGRAPDPSARAIDARRGLAQIARFFRAEPIYESALYWVIGQELTLAEFSRRQRWGSGAGITPEVAASKVKKALAKLSQFYTLQQQGRLL